MRIVRVPEGGGRRELRPGTLQGALRLNEDTSWYEHGACRGMTDPDVFFPERGASLEPAKAICRGCPVRQECLEYGMDEKFGVWGGLSERERRRLRRDRRRRCVVCGRVFRCSSQWEHTCSDECRAKNERERKRKHRHRRPTPMIDAGHGTISRYQSGCHCPACRRASRDKRAEARERAADAGIIDPGSGEMEVA